jgi:G:T-mismatch repair DNA endonuclease (very short patch repair protein)
MARDEKVQEQLRNLGWEIFIVRECTVAQDTAELIGILCSKRDACEAA